ncbi:probable glutamate receptor [Penaeus chinensis]|uniref:probable glutamate receptor n=1 Tax=Penaeus chinensis TaxID=139456 RepID=UPI001FB69A40|nr:probable glutamate receptor [Penaeus chinensis]
MPCCRISTVSPHQAPGAPQRTQLVGRWDEGRGGSPGALEGPHEDVASRRTNLTGLHVRCLSLESQPSIFTEKVGNRTVKISGWMADLWEEIRVLSNFTYTCRTPLDGEWGAPKARAGEWSGMVGELDQRTSDVIVAPLDHTQARSRVVDYCMGIQMSGYHLVLRRPDNNESAWTSFTREFQWQVWLVVGFTLLVSSFVFYATGKSPFEGETVSLGDAFLLVFGSLCAQSTSLQLSSSSSRIAFVTIYLNTMLLYAFYTCFIISHLAVTAYSHPFNTLQELYEKRDEYDFGFVKGISVEGSFKLAPDGLYKDVWRDMVEPKYGSLVRSDDEGIRRVLAGRYVHLMYGKKFQFKYAHDCDLMILPMKYMTIATTFAVQKGSPLRRIFTYHLMRLRDTGIFQRHWRRWRPRPSSCDAQKSLQAFTLNNLMTAFLALIVLAIAAFLTLAFERLTSRCRGLVRDVDLVATVETNTSWTRLHNQLSRMTLDVFKVQTTFTTTFIRKAREEKGKKKKGEEKGDVETGKRGARIWNVEESGRKRKMIAPEIEEERVVAKKTEEKEEDVIEEMIEGNERDEVAELEEAGLRKIATIKLNSGMSDKFNLPDIY